MTEPTIRPLGQYEPTTGATPEYHPPKRFQVFIEGQPTIHTDDRPNTATVQAETLYSDEGEDDDEGEVYADAPGVRQLVLLDTNYKAGRQGQHPVYLARTDALRTAVALLDGTADTFHARRIGPLRPAEAADVLRELDTVQASLDQLRRDALTDLLNGTIDKPDNDLDDLDEDGWGDNQTEQEV